MLFRSWNGWANEQILTGDDIDNMYNECLPLWVTATCDFAAFDDFKNTGGERLLRNPNGGAVALFTTTRTVFSYDNLNLNWEFTKYMTAKQPNGEANRLGDIMRYAKNGLALQANSNRLSFTLLGNPALTLGYPRSHKVQLDSINGKLINDLTADTISALGVVRLSGSLVDSGAMDFDASFNGLVYLTVFDNEEQLKTLDNDQPDETLKRPCSCRDRPNPIFSGSAGVVDGKVTITFMLPEDIRYNFGTGRFVFYASDDDRNYEANGSYDKIIVGGEDKNAVYEDEGPEITAYLNTPHFRPGDQVNSTPLFVAHLWDASGINTVGSGIGHDIVLKLNNDPNQEYVLNNYYESVLGSYQEGYVHYQFSELQDGKYSLMFRAWDLQNNSSTVSFDFVVKRDLPEIGRASCRERVLRLV